MPTKTPPSIPTQAEQIDRDLAAIRQLLRRPLKIEQGGAAITIPQADVMRIVARQPGISLKDLSHQLSLAHSTVSGIVDRLEKQKMLLRKPDPTDGRAIGIHPTQPVADFVRKELPRLSQAPLQKALTSIKPTERDQITQAIHRLRQLLETKNS